ncbi:MAG: NAD-dependent epimerase/dehydratase family protein, partial [Gammaproteobacteria bacterium]|nr:NAD-dependent epimerase/dehydratase family protein [Gammaproteobacteria bacterium]
LVMGISGAFGGHVAQALAQQGWQLKALMRDPKKLPKQFSTAEVCQGDAANLNEVRNAASDVELIVYGISPANYNWEGKAFEWLNVTAQVAEEKQLCIVFPGNVYVFNPEDGPVFTEQSPMRPIRRKGQIRLAMEKRLKQAAEQGAKVIIFRMGDFIGANVTSTWIQQLIKSTKKGYKLLAPGPVNLAHTWAYLPDVAQTIAALVEKKDSFEVFNVFHFKGYQASLQDIANCIGEGTGKTVKISAFPWFLMRLLKPFSVLIQGLFEMNYLWREPVLLSDEKLQKTLGKAPLKTNLSSALLEAGLLGKQTETKTEHYHSLRY